MCRVNRFRVTVDFVRDPNRFQILSITVLCSTFDGGLFVCLNTVKPARYKKYFYVTETNTLHNVCAVHRGILVHRDIS